MHNTSIQLHPVRLQTNPIIFGKKLDRLMLLISTMTPFRYSVFSVTCCIVTT